MSGSRQALLQILTDRNKFEIVSIRCSWIGIALYWLVSTLCSVSLFARKGRREYTDQSKVAFDRTHEMAVMLIEDIDATGSELKRLAAREVYNLAFASEAIICLHMVPILQLHLCTLFDCRIVEGKTYAVGRHDQPLAVPAFPANVPLCPNGRLDITY
jgi:hypothetical protein